MVQHEENILVSIYNGKSLDIEIPQGIYVYLIEIDSTNSKWGEFMDIYILTNDDIIYYGPLEDNYKQFNLDNWVSKGEPIRFQFSLNSKLISNPKRWLIVNDQIKIRIKGYESVCSVDYEDDWSDLGFQQEWA